MARAFKDGAGSTYDGTTNQFAAVPYGQVMVNETNPGAGKVANPTGKFFEIFSFGTTADEAAAKANMKKQVDNSNAGNLRDCAECHVGGGMNEYSYANMPSAAYNPAARTSLRTFDFGAEVTAWNYFVDIFNPDTTKRGEVVKQDYAQTGVLEMDCLMCHQDGYSWEARKHAVQQGEFDASRAIGAGLTHVVRDVAGHVVETGSASGTTVFYNYTAVKTNASGKLYVDLSASLNGKPKSDNCAACHHTRFNVEWKKRGEQWFAGSDVHYSLGCMACHERKNKDLNGDPTLVGTAGTMADTKLGLCDPAKGGASDYEAMWNKLDTVGFKECSDCHEPATTPTWPTYGAPNSATSHAAKGLTAKIAVSKTGAPISHIDLIDCTTCHLYKDYEGGTMIDGTGADAEGRVALHDEYQMGRDNAGTEGNALYWGANGKLYATGLSTSAFVRDMNGMDTVNGGLDGNNDGRNAGMDTLLQTHVNDLNNAVGGVGLSKATNADGSWVNEAEVTALFARFSGDNLGTASAGTGTYPGGLKQLLGISDANNDQKFIPKLSFLMVPFKSSHSIAGTATHAWGKNGCADCHSVPTVTAEGKKLGGFYNGAYPVKGVQGGFDISGTNFKYRFMSNQVTTYTKVNGASDTTDSHPSLITKKGDRSVPVKVVSKFDGPYVPNASATANETLREIDRSETIYESTFQTRDTTWKNVIVGTAPAASCSGPTSPFFCATPTGIALQDAVKSKATSTRGWVLRVEIKDAAAPGGVRFRTAQLSKDNAVSMAEVFAALPASFKTNPDFTVTEAGGALTITGATVDSVQKELRISPLSDVAPLGLKGQLWIADPIIRNTSTLLGRADFVGYLNSVETDMTKYGIGIAPVAKINTVIDDNATILGVQWTKNLDHAISAAVAQPTAPLGTANYLWTTSDVAAVITNPTSRDTAKIKFTTTGAKTITLAVTDEEDQTRVTTTTVNVTEAPIAIAYDGVAKTATFTNLPVGTTQVRVYWGDGTQTTKTSGVADPLTLPHTYATVTAKIVQIYCYSAAGKTLGIMQATITP